MASKKFSLESVLSLTDGITGPMTKMQSKMMGFSKTMKKNFGGVGKDIGVLSKGIDKVAKGMVVAGGVIITAIGAIGLKAIELASDLTEVQNVVDTTFGAEGAKKINEWSKAAITKFGLSELQAKKFNGTMGAMLKSSGMSVESIGEMSTALAGLAGDFASFYNLDAQEAFDKIRSGISGETEPLKQLGINMSVANLEAFALTQGIKKSWKNMKQGEQIQLRYAFLMKSSADAQGDFSKTLATSWANQKRVISTKFWDIMANAVSKLLPMLVEYGKLANDVLDKVSLWSEANKELIATKIQEFVKGAIQFLKQLVTFMKFIWPLVPYLLTLVIAIKAISAATTIMNIIMAANPISLIVIAIAALIAMIIIAVKNFDTFGAAVLLLLGPFGQLIIAIMIIKDSWAGIVSSFKEGGLLEGIKAIGATLLQMLVKPLMQVLDLLSKIPGVGKLLSGARNAVAGFSAGLDTTINKYKTPAASYSEPGTYGAETRSVSETRTSNEVFVRPDRGAAVSTTRGGPAQPSLAYGRQQ